MTKSTLNPAAKREGESTHPVGVQATWIRAIGRNGIVGIHETAVALQTLRVLLRRSKGVSSDEGAWGFAGAAAMEMLYESE